MIRRKNIAKTDPKRSRKQRRWSILAIQLILKNSQVQENIHNDLRRISQGLIDYFRGLIVAR